MFAFFKGGLKAACGFLRNTYRENHINPFSILIWVDGTSPAWWDLNFYEVFSPLTASSVASKHPEELLNPQQPFKDFSTPCYYSQRSLIYNQSSLPRRCYSGYSCSGRTFHWDTVSLLFALSSIPEPTISPTVSPQVLHKPSSFTQTGRVLIQEKAVKSIIEQEQARNSEKVYSQNPPIWFMGFL